MTTTGAMMGVGFLVIAVLAASGSASGSAGGMPADRPHPTIDGRALADVPDEGLAAAMAAPDADDELRVAIRREMGIRCIARSDPGYAFGRTPAAMPPDPRVLVDGRALRDVPDGRLREAMADPGADRPARDAMRREIALRAIARTGRADRTD